VSADAQAAGIWVNSADDPARCSFQLPALVRRDPVVVAVSSSGRSPALARWLRDRIAADLGPDIEWLAEQLAARRDELHRLGQSTEGLDWAGEIDRLRATRAC
jgi:siroheme synthase-like protein